jgi:HCOMODA/2-hydroxy-3-carboxy-muconic semialdehyde decarboxylase
MKVRLLLIESLIFAGAVTIAAQVGTPPKGAKEPARDPAKRALIEDLVLANRILASKDLGFLDPFGHISVRDPAEPGRYYMARYVSAGMVTADDIIAYDLDSNPIDSSRADNFNERFIHGEIYKARPDVMAVVHSHTPELVTFSISSIPLRAVFNGGAFIGEGIPNFDIRKFNNGNIGIVSSPALGRELAKELGSNGAILMYAHGAVTVDSSLINLVTRADYLRQDAQIEMAAIQLGGTVDYVKQQPRPRASTPRPSAPPDNTGANGSYRAWEYWKRQFSVQ